MEEEECHSTTPPHIPCLDAFGGFTLNLHATCRNAFVFVVGVSIFMMMIQMDDNDDGKM